MQEQVHRLVAHLFREQAGKMTAALLNLFGFENLALAEDVVQETFMAACRKWPFAGIPEQPAAWLMVVARNKAINALKQGARIKNVDHSVFLSEREDRLQQQAAHGFTEKELLDSELKLLFLCCQPELPEKSRIILTLKVLCGFSPAEIANALLMQQEAVKKNLQRSKQELRGKKLCLHTSHALLSDEKADTVLQVLYLMFNEGYKTTEDEELINKDLCFEAIRLCRLLLPLRHKVSEINALLALMFFNIARFPARTGEGGDIILLNLQDRTLWDSAFIREAFCYLAASREGQELSRYHLEAGIAAVHCSAASHADTDWKTIIFYYDKLLLITPSPAVSIHRAIAVAEAYGASQGMSELDKVNNNSEVEGCYLLHAAKAELYFRLESFRDARGHYEAALNITRSAPGKKLISSCIQQCVGHLKNKDYELFR